MIVQVLVQMQCRIPVSTLIPCNTHNSRPIRFNVAPFLYAAHSLLVWFFSLAAGWETFHELQVLGFLVLISGVFL